MQGAGYGAARPGCSSVKSTPVASPWPAVTDPHDSPRPPEDSPLNDLAKNIVLWIVIAVVVATVVSNFSARSGAVQDIPYSTFLEQMNRDRKSVV